MAIKLSGNLSMLNDIVAEFGGSEPHKISDYYSDGTLPTTGYITFSDFYGQASSVTINITISSNTNNYNLWNSKGGTYSAGKTTVNVTINSGVTIGSTTSGTYAFTTGLGWVTGDVINITNNGTIKGGGGGAGVTSSSGGAGGTASGANPSNTPGGAGSAGSATAGGAGGSTQLSAGPGGAGGGLGANGIAGTTADQPTFQPSAKGTGGSGGVRGYYQVGSIFINGGSGLSGTVGGRSA